METGLKVLNLHHTIKLEGSNLSDLKKNGQTTKKKTTRSHPSFWDQSWKKRKDTAVESHSETDLQSCPCCDDNILLNAPRNNEKQVQLLRSICCGARFSLWRPREQVWAEGVVLNKLNHGIWEVKCSDDDEQKGPCCYHLLHFSIKNSRQPIAPVPQKLSWKGALHDQSLVSATDIVCNISSYAATDSGSALFWGNNQCGLAGPLCIFSMIRGSEEDAMCWLREVLAGLCLVHKF